MITGVHAVVFSREAERMREFFADVLGTPQVDAGGGWPILALPPAELAVHPDEGPARHELYLMCDDLQATLSDLRAKGIDVVGEITVERWGLLAHLRTPDGGQLPIYQPSHPSPLHP